jgi:hypothetical protein
LSSVGLVDQGVGNAGGHDVQRAGRNLGLGLQPLVAFHALGVVVLGLALFPGHLDAVDAAVLEIDVVEVIDEAAVKRLPVRAVGADAIRHDGEKLFFGGQRALRQHRERDGGHQQGLAIREHDGLLLQVCSYMKL